MYMVTLKKNEKYDIESEKLLIPFSSPPSAAYSLEKSCNMNQNKSYSNDMNIPSTNSLNVHFLILSVFIIM